jgi:hypothetical protein
MTGPLRTLPIRDQLDAVSRHVGHNVEIRTAPSGQYPAGRPVGGILIAVAQVVDEVDSVASVDWVAVLSPRVGSKVGTAVPLRTVSTIMRDAS